MAATFEDVKTTRARFSRRDETRTRTMTTPINVPERFVVSEFAHVLVPYCTDILAVSVGT